MRKKSVKLLSVILCAMMVFVAAALPIAADEETVSNHTLTDNTLIKKYGLVCGSSDSTDGTNPDIAYAKISSADNNAYLEIKFGESSSYPRIFLSGDKIPGTLTDYTVSMDVIVVEESANKLVNTIYAEGNNGKFGVLGFRTGEYIEGKTPGIIYINDMAKSTDSLYIGHSDPLKDIEVAKKGAVYTLEVMVKATAAGAVPTIKTVFEGVEIANTNDVALKSSRIGISAWKGSTFGFDNICVKNNTSGEIVFEEKFEDHSYGDTLQAIDDDCHGYSCVCGVAVTEAHTYDAGVEVDDENSCNTKKSMKYTCSVCEHVKTVSNAHTPGDPVVVEDTCYEDGLSTVYCTVCGEVLEQTVLKCDGHDFGMWEKTDKGKKRTCTVCGYVEEVNSNTETQATESAAGETTADASQSGGSSKKGCGSVIAMPVVGGALACAAAVLLKKKKKNKEH